MSSGWRLVLAVAAGLLLAACAVSQPPDRDPDCAIDRPGEPADPVDGGYGGTGAAPPNCG